jgi:ferredoxin
LLFTNYQSPITNYQLLMSVSVIFLPDEIAVDAEAGEPLLQVAERAGVFIPTGCLMGSCHACEVEVEDGHTICACITAVPAGCEQLTINLYVDPAW